MHASLIRVLIACCLVAVFHPAASHEARPVFVQITESPEGIYSAHWKIPSSIPEPALPELLLPTACTGTAEPVRMRYPDAYIARQQYLCPQGLSGQVLELRYPVINPSVSALFRVELANGEIHNHIMTPGEQLWRIPEQENVRGVALEYTRLGIRHIFAGVDHLLFIACLIFIAGTGRRILITVTGFTLAHSLTLALSTLRIVELPVPPVEAAIALSIVFLAHEIALGNRNSWTWRHPVLVSSSFGLLHGFGFAAVLRAIGLPQTELPAALLFFNIGVEAGQVLFICLLAGAFQVIRHILSPVVTPTTSTVAGRTASYAIGSIASFWLIVRVTGFWS